MSRVAEATLSGRSELRSELETIFSGPNWPQASASLDAFKRYAIKVYDINAVAYRNAVAAQGKDPSEALKAMVRNLLKDVFGSEWENCLGESVIRTDWQHGAKGWKGKEVAIIAGNDPDPNCLYHQLIGDAIKYRYRFYAIPLAPCPGEPPGINLSNLEWWRYIGLNERHNLAMATKPYLEDHLAHWQFVYATPNPPVSATPQPETSSVRQGRDVVQGDN